MTFNKVPEPKTDKNRLHLDVISHTLDAETERLLSLGARRLRDVEFDRRAGIAATRGGAPPPRTSTPSGIAPATGSWPTPPTARARWQRGTPAVTRPVVGDRAVLRPIYTEPEIASVALTQQQARQQHGNDVATGLFAWIANARAVMQDEHAGWVKSIHETRAGRMLGLVMVGPHVTDMVEAGVIAIDAGATVETVADAMAPHPTLSEAIRGAALVALGRAIDIPIPRIQIS
jgi:hypothetical protein